MPELSEEARLLDGALIEGDSAEVQKRLAAVTNIKAGLSARNLYFVSRALSARSNALAGAGKHAAALAAVRTAVEISPDDVDASLLVVRRAFKADPADINGWSAPLKSAVRAWLNHPLHLAALKFNLLALLVFSAFTAFALFLGAVFSAHARAVVGDFRRLMPVYMEHGTARVALALAVLAALCATGVFVTLLAIGLLLAGQMKPRGKAVMAVFIIFFIALPLFGRHAGKGVVLLDSPDARAADRFLTGGFEPDDIKVFEAAYRRNSADTRLMLMLGTMDRRVQKYDAAETHLKNVIHLDPKNVAALVEMGNVHFNRQEYREAEIMYKNALGLSPSLFAGHYNLGAVYLEQFRTEESNAELDVAARLDPARANQLMAAKGNKNADKVISVRLEGEMPAYIAREVEEGGLALADRTSAFFLWGLGTNAHIAVMTAYLFLFASAGFGWARFGVHETCGSCGAVFLPMFEKPDKGVYKCNQCVAYASPQKSGILGLKEKKVKEILNHQFAIRNTAMWMNILAPGMGGVWKNQHPAGAFFLVITSAFLVGVAGVAFVAALGYRLPPPPALGALAGAMALYYLLAIPFSGGEK